MADLAGPAGDRLRPSWSEVVALGLVLGFGAVLARGWPTWTSDAGWTAVGAIATAIGVLVALHESWRARKAQQIAKALTDLGYATKILTLMCQTRVVAERISRGELPTLHSQKITAIRQGFDALDGVVAGRPGMAILINAREVVGPLELACDTKSLDPAEYGTRALKYDKLYRPMVRGWRDSIRRELKRLGESAPGFND